jgi:hypothetical protein
MEFIKLLEFDNMFVLLMSMLYPMIPHPFAQAITCTISSRTSSGSLVTGNRPVTASSLFNQYREQHR